MSNNTHSNSSIKPWLSVIVPIYNSEKWLAKCIDSILNQAYTNFELLLVDDGSTDSSSEICKVYSNKDSRVKYFRKPNGGSFQTRLYGAKRAEGTYILFCDSDDYYISNQAFSILHNYAEKYNCQVIQFGFFKKYNHLKQRNSFIDQPMLINQKEFSTNEYPGILCNIWDSSRLQPTIWSKLYHRSLIENLQELNTSEHIFWGDDLITNLYLLKNCKSMLYIPDTLYVYRQLSGSTNEFSLRTMEDLNNIKQYQLDFLDLRTEKDKDEIKHILFLEIAHWFYIYSSQAIKHLNEQEFKKLIVETLALPSFVATRQYYLNDSRYTDIAVNLIKKADPDLYLNKAREYNPNKNFKSKIFAVLKQIYQKI